VNDEPELYSRNYVEVAVAYFRATFQRVFGGTEKNIRKLLDMRYPDRDSIQRQADHSSRESYRLYKKDYETEEEARAQQRAVEPLMNGYTQVAFMQMCVYKLHQ
jgi:hypothetical protein